MSAMTPSNATNPNGWPGTSTGDASDAESAGQKDQHRELNAVQLQHQQRERRK